MAVPYHRPSLGLEETEAVRDVLDSGWLTTGVKTQHLEAAISSMVGADHAVALNSATAALHLALASCGVGPGDEVVIPTHTFAATGEVVFYMGATPVLVDVHEDTLNVDPVCIEKAITSKTKAIIPVHYGGQAAEMDTILELAGDNMVVIEDAAHALPTRYGDRMVGSIGLVTAFSFYANKTVTMGEGGVLTTNDEEIAAIARRLSLHGLSRDAWDRFKTGASWEYDIVDAGYKYNLTDIAAAIGCVQLEKAEDLRGQRQTIAARYDSVFNEREDLAPLVVKQPDDSAWHLYVIRLELEKLTIDRDEFIRQMTESGIGTSVHYKPLHLHTLYKDRLAHTPSDFPIATRQFERIVSLPLFPDMSTQQVEEVIDAVTSILDAARR